jgi:hypothetical protein
MNLHILQVLLLLLLLLLLSLVYTVAPAACLSRTHTLSTSFSGDGRR